MCMFKESGVKKKRQVSYEIRLKIMLIPRAILCFFVLLVFIVSNIIIS